MISLLLLVIGFLIVRTIRVYYFIKQVSKVCDKYDWNFVEDNERYVIDIMKENYYLNCEWSAYNFLFLNGPSPTDLFFSLKPLTIENQYDSISVDKLKKYEII
jgi:hypothetical protein